MSKPRILAVGLLVAFAVGSPAVSAESEASIVRLGVSRAVKYDLSAPLTEMVSQASAPEVGPAGMDREVPLHVVERARVRSSDPHVDEALQTRSIGVSAPDAIENFAGLGQVSGVTPPDTEGDVGLDYVFEWINSAFAIWDKDDVDAGPVMGPTNGNTIFAGFGGPCEANNDGDPIVFFDHLANRWFLSQFSIDEGTECIAISTTSDPMGPYHRYAFVPIAGQRNDYPHCGLWVDSYLCTYRMFPSNVTPFATFQAMDRAAMLAGDPNAEQVVFGLTCLANDCPDGVMPIHLQGPAPPAGPALFVKDWDDDFNATGAASDGYRMWALDVDWTDPGSASFMELPRATTTDWDQDMCGFFVRDCVPQPAPATAANNLDAIDELTMWRVAYRHFDTHDAIVVTHTIDATGGDVAGMRWAELRNTGARRGGGWEVFQDGVFSPDSDNRWMGSIAMDKAGNIGMAYSVSSTSTRPSVRYTGRMASDPPGTMRDERTLVEGTGVNQSTTNRWGDYSSISIDPEDDCTFWMFQEYMEVTGISTYATRGGSFAFPSCSTDIFADAFESGNADAWSNSLP